ncbi:hypothetical protein ADK53_18045, partial [Streptomyces sp. WM6373]
MTVGPTDPGGPAAPGAAGPAGELCGRVDALCRAAAPPHLPPGGPVAAALAAVRLRLAEPGLRIAVGRRMNAGKSTLVNALLGRRLAATECTTLVAWFRDGVQNRLEVCRTDGRRYHMPGRASAAPLPRGALSQGSAPWRETARAAPHHGAVSPEQACRSGQFTRSTRARRIRFLPGSRTLSKAALLSRTQLPEGPF